MNDSEYKRELAARMVRWRAFHERNDAGDLMVYGWWDRQTSLEGYLAETFCEHGTDAVLEAAFTERMMEDYVTCIREGRDNITRFDDDCVPTSLVYWGIGACNAAITGGEPFHDGMTCWYEPERTWEEIAELKFDPNNKWVDFALRVNQALWRRWEGDFHVLPFLYRSPLDAANGIRGNDLFEEMYTDPQAVHKLINWTVDWSVQMEQFLAANDGRQCEPGWGTAVWGAWLPDGAVFVNGDPVGLISREMALEFEQPYTQRLFESTGGGFYHNHTIGLFQADMVAKTPGTLVQYMIDDPNQPSGEQALLDIPELQEMLLAASMDSPIAVVIQAARIDEAVDVARHGRFVFVLGGEADEMPDAVARVRKASGI